MTVGRPAPPDLVVVGEDAGGVEVIRLVLGHGEDPVTILAARGWAVRRARDVTSHWGQKHVLAMTFVVEARAVGLHGPEVPPLPDDDLVPADGEVPERYQRVAAYAVVTSRCGLLMTQLSERTNAEGQWGLPGGGLEADEAPDRAVLREVWEESGQVIEVGELATVHTSHWIGRAPSGRLEDFHAVRLVFRARCHAPTEPVVHDVGGTTAAAAWVPTSNLDGLDFAPGWRSLMSGVVMAPDQAEGPERHEQDSDHDDGTRPQP